MDENVGKYYIELGQWLLEHPGFDPGTTTINMFAWGDEFKRLAKSFGACEKVIRDDYYILRKRFGPIIFDLFSTRTSVCERVQVGEKEIPEQVIPARSEEIVPAHKEPIYEWKCPESILADTKADEVTT